MRLPRRTAATTTLITITVTAATVHAQTGNCAQTSVGLTPINDLTGTYLGQYNGGLYPTGNNPPQQHHVTARNNANDITPRDLSGAPNANGKSILLSMGMSNTTQEFCSQGGNLPCNPWTFMGQAARDPTVDTDHLVIVNGARGGQSAGTWDSPTDPNYDRVRDMILAPMGLSEAQVQAVWLKVANPRPTLSLPDPNADAFVMQAQIGDIARAIRSRYPNTRLIFMSSRIYAGYAVTLLNPEPYAYETGFSVKWAIEAQINQRDTGVVDPITGDLSPAAAPTLVWGPYLWADGLIPRSDGLVWECTDLDADGTHPATDGERKVGTALLEFMRTSPYARPWFRADGGNSGCDGDLNGDNAITTEDLLAYLALWFAQDPQAQRTGTPAITIEDLLDYLVVYFTGACA